MSEDELISLLEAARTVTRDRLVPALSDGARYDALMVANALGIAARRTRDGDQAEREELLRLRALYGDQSAPLRELRYRLVYELRTFALERGSERRAAILHHLRLTAAAATAITNPRARA